MNGAAGTDTGNNGANLNVHGAISTAGEVLQHS
jgi:hypothetical protein